MNADEVLSFWLEEIKPRDWWISDAEFDKRIRRRFGELLRHASAGELFEWRITARGRLAEIIVLDQIPRNAYRHTPSAFAQAANHTFELKHKVIIDRFGRYPHRNEILGRESTDDEIEFLKQPGSSF